MIGIFDSGSGGLTFLNAVKKILPQYDYCYFWDYENCPYGNKNSDEIRILVRNAVIKLKNAWAKIVILACNTATAHAIKSLQKDEKILWVKVLGVTIPGAERVLEENFKKITVIATNSSVRNRLYKKRVKILDESVEVQEIGMENLAKDIELMLTWQKSMESIRSDIIKKLMFVWKDSEAIILGCTHYSHIKGIFEEIFPNICIVDPSIEAAKKMKIYLQNHPEIEKNLTKNGMIFDISSQVSKN